MNRSPFILMLLGLMTSLLAATEQTWSADKYQVPPHPASTAEKCAVDQAKDYPETSKMGNNWIITTTGKYNYDDTWSFKSLQAEIIYTKGTTSRAGPETTITDESTIGTPGSFTFTYVGVAPPEEGEVMALKVTITVKKTGEPDKKEAHAKPVPAPQ